MQHSLVTQYKYIVSARLILLSYCKTIAYNDLQKNVSEFNNKSIAYMLAHNADTYMHWLIKFDQGIPVQYMTGANGMTINDIEKKYEQVDTAVYDFLRKYESNYLQQLTKKRPDEEELLTVTPLQIFTHVITHEFHHKGQILSMSRLLGYIPEDTDVIR